MSGCSPWTKRCLCLSFLCSKTISVVFQGGTRSYIGLDGGGVGWRVSSLGWDGVDWAWHHCIGAWVLSVPVILGFSGPPWVVAPLPV